MRERSGLPKVTLLWSGEDKTAAIGDHQARELLTAHGEETVKEKRDRAILSTLLYHALRREKLCRFKVRDSGTHDAACRISRSPAGREDAVSAIAGGGTNELIHRSATPTSPPPTSTITARHAPGRQSD